MKEKERIFIERSCKKMSDKYKLKEETIRVLIIKSKTDKSTYKKSKKIVEKFLKVMQ